MCKQQIKWKTLIVVSLIGGAIWVGVAFAIIKMIDLLKIIFH